MLNRLFVAIGVFAILALTAAFVVPSFWPWESHRANLEAMAAEAFGAPVAIDGDISFSILPAPKLRLGDVRMGPTDAPSVTVAAVEADFSLLDFLRDHYALTRLLLQDPVVHARVSQDGGVEIGLPLGAPAAGARVFISRAVVADGTFRLTDERSGRSYVAERVAGEVSLDALGGPLSFEGSGVYEGSGYAVRLTTGLAAGGTIPLAGSLRPTDGGFSITIEGQLSADALPSFSGSMIYRQPPPPPPEGEEADAGRGDLVITGALEATAETLRLADYVVLPDENRATTRLEGEATMTLGAAAGFSASIEGGVVALPPRDATAEQAVPPYEIVRLLRELPLPAAPGLPGRVSITVGELDLRAFALRNVELAAEAHEDGWTIERFAGQLPGATTLSLAGTLTTRAGRPEFAGRIELDAGRLDALATLWRKPADGNPLFNMPGALDAKVDLVGETLSLSDARFTIDGETRSFAAQIGFGAVRDLHLTLDLGALDRGRSEALLAFFPDLTKDAGFAATFPKGQFDLRAARLTLDGLDGRDLAARGTWDGGVLVVDDARAADLGGSSLAFAATVFGTLERPELSGSGSVSVRSANAPLVGYVQRALDMPPIVRSFLSRAYPLDLTLELEAPTGEGAQKLALGGRAGPSALTAKASLAAGFLRAFTDQLQVDLDLRAEDAAAMTAQLGLGEEPLLGAAGPLHLVARIDGHVANSLETTLRLERGAESLGFSGNVVVTDPDALSGTGAVKAQIEEADAVLDLMGLAGLTLPAFEAGANLSFDGRGDVRLTDLAGTSGGEAFGGTLSLSGSGGTRSIGGRIEAGRIDAAALVRLFGGRAASFAAASGPWPDGPLDLGSEPRTVAGRVALTATGLTAGARQLLGPLGFELDWSAAEARLRDFSAEVGGGSLGLELTACCTGPLAGKQVTGRVSLDGVSLDSLVPEAIAEALEGTITGAGQFSGTGTSIAELMGGLNGDGAWSIGDLRIERLDPTAIPSLAGLDSVLDMQPEEVTALLVDRLDDGPFVVAEASGSFTLAGGMLRSPNVAMTGVTGDLFGSGALRLADLALEGDYTLSAPGPADAAALSDEGPAQVRAVLAGTLIAPERSFDVSGLVDAIMVRAYEMEVTRLEALRAEDDARRQAEAEEQARLAAEEAAARQAAEEAAAAQAAADAAARQRAAEEAARQKAAADAANRPMDLGLGN